MALSPSSLAISFSLPHELFLLQVIWLQLFCSSEAEIKWEWVLKLNFHPHQQLVQNEKEKWCFLCCVGWKSTDDCMAAWVLRASVGVGGGQGRVGWGGWAGRAPLGKEDCWEIKLSNQTAWRGWCKRLSVSWLYADMKGVEMGKWNIFTFVSELGKGKHVLSGLVLTVFSPCFCHASQHCGFG